MFMNVEKLVQCSKVHKIIKGTSINCHSEHREES